MVCTCEKGSSRVGQNPLIFSFSGQKRQKKDSLSVCLGLSLVDCRSFTATLAVAPVAQEVVGRLEQSDLNVSLGSLDIHLAFAG